MGRDPLLPVIAAPVSRFGDETPPLCFCDMAVPVSYCPPNFRASLHESDSSSPGRALRIVFSLEFGHKRFSTESQLPHPPGGVGEVARRQVDEFRKS